MSKLLFLIFLPFTACIEQLHLAQGRNYESMTISWLSQEKTNSFISYWLNKYKLNLNANGTISTYNFGSIFN